MKLQEHKINGLYTIRPDLHKDVRGVFCRSFCENELAQHGKNFKVSKDMKMIADAQVLTVAILLILMCVLV